MHLVATEGGVAAVNLCKLRDQLQLQVEPVGTGGAVAAAAAASVESRLDSVETLVAKLCSNKRSWRGTATTHWLCRWL